MPFMEILFIDDGRVIRPCGVDDLEDVSSLVIEEAKQSIKDDFDAQGWQDFEEYLSFEQLLKRLVTGSQALVIQEADDRISGYIEINGNQLFLLFIAKDVQNRNLAKKLLNRVQETLNLEELYVHSSTGGYQFYRAQGFHPLGDWDQKGGVKFRPLKWQRPTE